MDILDTFGDWVQLFGFGIGLLVVSYVYSVFTNGFGLFGVPIAGYFIWTSVYDYDVVLGLLIGGVIGAIGYFQLAMNTEDESSLPSMGAGILCAVTAVIMMTKIIMFW